MVGQTVSHYKILEKLGEGGMGVVYKAEDTRLKRTVALKFLPRHLSSSEHEKLRFMQEAQSASSLNHPNISHIYEIDEVDGETFIAMEFIDGRSLRNLINAGPLKINEAIRFALQIAEGLRAAHRNGIVHRDIKPENILITRNGEAKIADFGLSLTVDQGRASDSHAVEGTACYMSPEQVRGEHVDHSSDIWSLGIVLYEMLAGKSPFKADYGEAAMYSILNERHHAVSTLRRDSPPRLERIIDRCLEKIPSARYRNAVEIISELQQLQIEMVEHQRGSTVSAKSIAVLPFADISPEKDNKYFSDGLTEEIIASLSKLRNLKVISRTSVMRYEHSEKTLKQIAAELGVQFILGGSVRKHGTDLRITAELIDAEHGTTLWAEKYRGKLEQIFDIQEEVAGKIVDALRVKLTPDEKRNLKKRFTENTEAYQLYLKGRFFWNKRNKEGLNTAIKYFKQAIEQDSRYAPAWVGLADAYNLLTEDEEVSRREAFQKAKFAVTRALEIDSRLAEAHASLAILVMLNEWDWANAEKEFRLAIELDPNYATAHHWFAEWLSMQGRHEEALQENSHAAELDPVSPAIIKDRGIILYYARRYDEAIEQGMKTLELDPNFALVHRLLSLAYQAKGMFDEAIAENRLWGSLTGDQAGARFALGHIYAVSGRRSEALDTIADLIRGEIPEGNLSRGIALVYAALGENDMAFTWLEKAYEGRAESLCNLKIDPKIDGLRNDPRFNVLLKKIGLDV